MDDECKPELGGDGTQWIGWRVGRTWVETSRLPGQPKRSGQASMLPGQRKYPGQTLALPGQLKRPGQGNVLSGQALVGKAMV